MANKKLKTIQFPGLPDTYTVPQVENGTNNNVAALDGAGNVKDSAIEVSKVAKTDGSYQNLNAGTSDQLNATVGVTDKVPYNFRTSGGSADIGNRLNDKIVGGTIVWNQGVKVTGSKATDNGITYTNYNGIITVKGVATDVSTSRLISIKNVYFVAGHKYLILGCPKGGATGKYMIDTGAGIGSDIGEGRIGNCDQTGYFYYFIYVYPAAGAVDLIFKPQLFDLTQMFGLTIADYIYSLEKATAGAGVAWFKNLFPKPYYAYNAGELMSVCTNAHITRGFNQLKVAPARSHDRLELNKTTFTRVVADKQYELNLDASGSFRPVISIYDMSGNMPYPIGTQLTDVSSTVQSSVGLYWTAGGVITSMADIASGKTSITLTFKKDFYISINYGFGDVSTTVQNACLHLTWSGYRNGEYEPYVEHRYPLSPIELRGIPKLDSANNLYFDGDTYEKDGTVTRKIVRRILNGTESWNPGIASSDDQEYYYLRLGDYGSVIDHQAICDKYMQAEIASANTVVAIDVINSTGRNMAVLMIRPVNVASMTMEQFKALLASSPVTVEYGISTHTIETANPFTDPQIIDDFGTEEYVDALATAETSPRDVEVPVGHETFYQANLRDKLQNLPENASEDGLYLVKQTENKQELIAYTPEDELPASPAETGTYILKLVDGTLTWVLEE